MRPGELENGPGHALAGAPIELHLLPAKLEEEADLHDEDELDTERSQREAMLVAVGNGVSYGGGMKVTPGAVLDDGEFAITVLKSISKLEFLRVFPRVYSGSHVEHPAVEVYSAKTIELAADGMTAYADGERFGTLPITAECVPGAWRVLAPPSR